MNPLKTLIGLVTLVRIVPVLSWSVSAIVIGAGIALRDLHTFGSVQSLQILIILGGAVVLQGIVAHSVNDRADWKSGTDRNSPGILSGGSKVIKKGYFTPTDLLVISIVGISMALVLGVALSRLSDHRVWIFISIGLWAAISYTSPPLRLSYVPFLGEWLAAFPAMLTCTVGTYMILTKQMDSIVFWAATVHALLCVAWLMQHHLSDLPADVEAQPIKRTTIVWVYQKWGIQNTIFVPATYYLLSVFVSLLLTLAVSHTFLVSIISSLLGMYSALHTHPSDVGSITHHQLKMIAITIGHSIFLVLLMFFR